MNRLYLLLFPLLILACKPGDSKTEQTDTPSVDTTTVVSVSVPGLKRLWDTDKTLITSESVLYDKNDNLFYVSCINGTPPDKKDKDGYIAKVGLDGKILVERWANGLSAPKGMGIADKMLYVTDIDRLVAIDLATGKIKKTWEVKGSSFLNDVHVNEDGSVYFTDSNTSTLYALMNDKVAVVHADTSLGGCNGVLMEGNTIYLAGFMSGNLLRMDATTKSIQTMASGIPGGDGVERYGEGLLVSNWNGEIYYVAKDGRVTEILDTQEAKLNSADIEIVADKNMLLVPTFFGNTVTAYELSKN